MQDLHLRTFYGLRPSKPPHSSTLPIIHGHAPVQENNTNTKRNPRELDLTNPRKTVLTVWFSKKAWPSRERGNRTHSAPGLSRRPLPIGISHAVQENPATAGPRLVRNLSFAPIPDNPSTRHFTHNKRCSKRCKSIPHTNETLIQKTAQQIIHGRNHCPCGPHVLPGWGSPTPMCARARAYAYGRAYTCVVMGL